MPGFTYFVTTKTWQNRAIFRISENASIFLQCLLHYRDERAYLLHEFVVMPNHLHVLLTPADDISLERAIQLIKGGSSHAIHQQRGHKMPVWQSGFHEESIRDQDDYCMKTGYIRSNPVRARLVEKPEHWSYGSAANRFIMDAPPKHLGGNPSGAKALQTFGGGMSELKLRPPNPPVSRGDEC